jgi:tRNA pseudouridine38-40 synthase
VLDEYGQLAVDTAAARFRLSCEEVARVTGSDVMRVRVDLAYDGGGFSGWAAQPGRRTVEGVLAETLGHVLRLPEEARLTVAGRTDAGVHARGQVAHADVPSQAWEAHGAAALRRLSRALPPDVRVRAIAPAPDGFDARFSALWRRYAYRICDDPARADPLRRHDTLWNQRPLDLAAMNAAALALTGEHDFAAFCRKREGATTVRALRCLDWERDADGVATGRVIADAFCHNMVRALVGALLPVGEGSRPPSWPAEVLAAAVRDPAVRVVPPHALSLEEVAYPPPDQLAERAVLTRRVRAAEAPGEGEADSLGGVLRAVVGDDLERAALRQPLLRPGGRVEPDELAAQAVAAALPDEEPGRGGGNHYWTVGGAGDGDPGD